MFLLNSVEHIIFQGEPKARGNIGSAKPATSYSVIFAFVKIKKAAEITAAFEKKSKCFYK
jgi:hypothetical protein